MLNSPNLPKPYTLIPKPLNPTPYTQKVQTLPASSCSSPKLATEHCWQIVPSLLVEPNPFGVLLFLLGLGLMGFRAYFGIRLEHRDTMTCSNRAADKSGATQP